MKELEEKVKVDQEIHADQQQEKKMQFIGSTNLQAGHKLWELDVFSGEIKEADFDTSEVVVDFEENRTIGRKKLIMKQGCLYAGALNKKNAFKKFQKMVNGRR